MKKIKNNYYWIIGGIIGISLFGLLYLLYSLPCEGECFELLIFGILASLPCKLLGIKSGCLVVSLIFWFLIGALIGLLISKLKKSF